MNILITKDDKIIELNGTTHEVAARLHGHKSLLTFLHSGGVRILRYKDVLCIECFRALSAKQYTIVNRILRQDKIYILISEINGEYKCQHGYRQIKRL